MWQLKWHQLLQAKLPHAASIAKRQRHRSPQFIACCAEHEEHVLQEPGLRYLLVHGWTEGQPISKGMSYEDKTAQLRFFGWHQPANLPGTKSQPLSTSRASVLLVPANCYWIVPPAALQLLRTILNGLFHVRSYMFLVKCPRIGLHTWPTMPRLALLSTTSSLENEMIHLSFWWQSPHQIP